MENKVEKKFRLDSHLLLPWLGNKPVGGKSLSQNGLQEIILRGGDPKQGCLHEQSPWSTRHYLLIVG
jgi:hypothetical protein